MKNSVNLIRLLTIALLFISFMESNSVHAQNQWDFGTIDANGNVIVPTTTQGNVGIGTATPTNKLTVQGNMNVNGKIGVGISSPTSQLHFRKVIQPTVGSSNNTSILLIEKEVISFPNSLVSPILSVRSDGTVGIGVDQAPAGYQLAVKGGIIAEEVKVKLHSTSWPDYVFETDYNLMPLEQLEDYISRNHHLPGVMSAEEVKENGIELGSMQATLLKKIEELTLYLLQIKNESDLKISILESENEKLKTALKLK